MENNINQNLDWDSVIENDNAFTLLPGGEYEFTVTGFQRGEFMPKREDSKIPPCKCAELTLTARDPVSGNAVELSDRLFLLKKFEWKLCQFFTCIGQRRHGEKLKMNWTAVAGARGRCKIEVHKFTGNDGAERSSNRIAEYLEPQEPASTGWKPGNF